jgi:SNF2 family DNA or RNA helicase
VQTVSIPTKTVPAAGQLVSVRQRRYVVTEVKQSALPLIPLSRSSGPRAAEHLLRLQSIDDDGLGEELSVIWELEPGTQLFERSAFPDPSRGFDDPARLDAFLDAVRWGAVASADVRSIHSPFRSGITIEDYQLDPVVRAIAMPRVNLLIADDVGLGKTIEAGLVLQELILRHRARTALVVCPAGLQLQWRDQMRDKFGLEFRIIDSEGLRELRRRRGLGVNPWTHFPRLITSIDFLKRERPMRLMRDVLPAPGEAVYPRRFDMLIVDEAHNVAPPGRGHYAVDDSLRTSCIRALAPHFEHKLFLTATPHNGYTESFLALLELLDDQRFHRGMEKPDPVQLEAVMVRRLKKELPKNDLGRARFAERELEAIEVDFTREEQAAHAHLQEYAELRSHDADGAADAFASQFLMKLLKKRLFSSPEAFRLTLEAHKESVARGSGAKEKPRTRIREGILRREIERVEEDYSEDDAYEEETSALVRTTSRALRPFTSTEEKLVDGLVAWAEKASSRLDAKAKALLAWLEALVRPNGKWSDTRVIIFTEYRATQKWLEAVLANHAYTQNGRLLTLYGGMDPKDRETIKHAFQSAPDVSGVRILLATDAASEGIDLQNHCSRLIHYEVPWNPNRMEQRNGRVDRHGQHADKVEIFHFVGKGWRAQRLDKETVPGTIEGDIEFLFRTAIKVNQIREDLGNAGDVLATQVEEAMLGKRKKLDDTKAAPRASAARKMLTFERKLAKQLAELMVRLSDSRKELHISPAAIKAVVDVGLELAQLPPLQLRKVKGSTPGSTEEAWMVPAFGGTWGACLDGLAHPHTHEMRPIVFDDEVAKDRDDIVLAHLGHKLVQMCVGLLRAEVWAPEGARRLSRVSARVVTALEHPVLVAHARLVVLGGDNTRLHEEVVVAGGALKQGRFKSLGPDPIQRALDNAAQERVRKVPPALEKDLIKAWHDAEGPLRKHLDDHMAERTDALATTLAERCEKEVSDHEAILRELERSLRADVHDPHQLDLWETKEREQLERDRQSMKTRLEAIPEEILRETQAIRARYANPTTRLFPVAVSYLVPATMVRA